jgi:uncharacterized protein (DUF427 family)
MTRAIWNGEVVAESDQTVVLGGTHYFPPNALKMGFFVESDHTSICGWKGRASYYDLVVAGKTNANAAWIYRSPKDAAAEIRGHVAFWNGVVVED